VQDRLKGIFEKVGVRSRRELVATIHVSEIGPKVAANDELVRTGRPTTTLRHRPCPVEADGPSHLGHAARVSEPDISG